MPPTRPDSATVLEACARRGGFVRSVDDKYLRIAVPVPGSVPRLLRMLEVAVSGVAL